MKKILVGFIMAVVVLSGGNALYAKGADSDCSYNCKKQNTACVGQAGQDAAKKQKCFDNQKKCDVKCQQDPNWNKK